MSQSDVRGSCHTYGYLEFFAEAGHFAALNDASEVIHAYLHLFGSDTQSAATRYYLQQ